MGSWKVDSEAKVSGQEGYHGVLLRSTLKEKGRLSRSGQREKERCDAVLMEAPANPVRTSEDRLILQNCLELEQENQVFIFHDDQPFGAFVWARWFFKANAIPKVGCSLKPTASGILRSGTLILYF